MIEEIPEFTFVHCTSVREVSLPATLHAIRVKAFMNCAALVELAILRYIGSRAFLDCTALKRQAKLPGKHKWRGAAEGLPTRPRFNVPFVGPKMDARSTLLGHVCSRSLPLRGNSS